MDKLMSFGKSLFGGGEDEEGGVDLSNPFAFLFQMDRDGDGKITEEDFISVIEKIGLGSFGEEAARQAFKQVDSNENGKLDMSEVMEAFQIVKDLVANAKGSSE